MQDEDALKDLTPEDLISSATHAYAIAKKLGRKVIIMSCSTGGTLSLLLASEHPEIAGLIMYSPNIRLKDPAAKILNDPWGLHIGRMVVGGKYYQYEQSEEYQKYWYTKYRVEGLVALQSLLESTMQESTFKKVKQPAFMAYYYKNDSLQDQLVSVKAAQEMMKQLSTPQALKTSVAIPEAGHHIMASYLCSKDLKKLQKETFRFADDILKLTPQKSEK